MHKLLNILFVLWIVCMNLACYDNKGSDSYHDVLNIQVTEIDSNISVGFADVLKITPKISPSDRDYDCFWGIASKGDNWGVIDTLSYQQNLEWKVNLKNGNYLLRFCARDVETGVFSYTEYNLSIETDMAIGWWLLKSIDGNTDIDIFTPSGVITDVVQKRNGCGLLGNAVDMSYTNSFWVYDETLERDVMESGVFVASANDIVCLDFFTGKILSNYEELFFELPAQRVVKSLFRGASDTHVFVGGKLYTMPNMRYASYKQFAMKHSGDYELSVHRNASGWSLPLLFDEKSSSFCTVTRNSLDLDYLGESLVPAPHKNLDMDLLFMGARTIDVNTYGKDAFAILKAKHEDKYYLAQLLGTPKTGRNPMQKELEELPATLGVVRATKRVMNQDNDIIYYCIDNKIYSYDLISKREKEQPINLSSGEVVTFMDYVKYTPWNMNDDWFSYLVLATSQGGNYKVYLYPVQAGNIRPAVRVMEGRGEVVRTIYIEMKEGRVNTSTYF